MSRRGWRNVAIVVTLLIGPVPVAMGFPVTGAIRVVTGLTSHTLCSQVLITGLEADKVYAESVRPQAGIGLLNWGIRYKVDRSLREVRTTFLGAFESRAVYRTGLGCVLGLDTAEGTPEAPFAEPGSVTGSVTGNPVLQAVIEQGLRDSKAIVIMRDGQFVGEAYAPGYNQTSRVPGWSASKSVINALTGILVRGGRLSLNQRSLFAEWANDGRREITVEHLLRMTSGLDLDETNSGFDPAARMLFVERDMAGFAIQGPLKRLPGTKMSYTDCNTVLLSRIIRDAVGGDVTAFARRELFEPLGIRNMLIESDVKGTPIGSTHIFGTARDWARFGALYLNDGVVNGRRILPEGWVRYSSQPTLGTRYAAGFWTNVDQDQRIGMPGDSFFASGHLGQKVLIVPSKQLVIARFAVRHKSDGDMATLRKLYAAAAANGG